MGGAIRRLRPDDAVAFRALRLEAVRRHPAQFGSCPLEVEGEPEALLAARLASEAVFGAFDGDALFGMAGFRRTALTKKRHKGELWGVYVKPDARRAGLGRALVETVIEYARTQVEQLNATVVIDNDAARGLYRALGFVPYGLEPRALKVGDAYIDQELIVLRL